MISIMWENEKQKPLSFLLPRTKEKGIQSSNEIRKRIKCAK